MLNFTFFKRSKIRALVAHTAFLLSTFVTQNAFADAEPTESKEVSKPLFAPFYSSPVYEGNVGVTAFTEYTYDATNPNNVGSNTYTKTFLNSNLYFSPQIYLDLDVMVNTSSGIQSNQNYLVDNAQIIFAKVAMRYENDDWWVSGGSGPINYSLAKRSAAGIWGTSLMMSEVGVKSKAGFAGAFKSKMGDWGNHAFYGALFMADNSFLSAPYGKNSDPYPLSNGGPSNTGKLNNFGLAVDGLKIAALPKFRYHLSSVIQQTQSLQVKNFDIPTQYLAPEYRYAAATIWDKVSIGGGVILSPLFEYNRINNRNGISGYNNNYFTGSGLFGYQQWNFGGSYTLWTQDWPNATLDAASGNLPSGGTTIPSLKYGHGVNNQGQVALGYLFSNGIGVTMGYRNENKQGASAQSVGLSVKYNLPFSIGF